MNNNKWKDSLSPEARRLYQDELNRRQNERYATDASRRKLFNNEKSYQRYRARRDAALAYLGGRCSNPACCWINSDGTRGCTDSRCLQIDHVLSDGAKRRKESGKEGSRLYHTVLKTTPGEIYQLLCANCNWIKRHEKRELPHARYTEDSFVFSDARKRRKNEFGQFLPTGILDKLKSAAVASGV